jgi:hypothetical protein
MREADDLTTFMCRMSLNLGTYTCWNSLGHTGPVTGSPPLTACSSSRYCCYTSPRSLHLSRLCLWLATRPTNLYCETAVLSAYLWLHFCPSVRPPIHLFTHTHQIYLYIYASLSLYNYLHLSVSVCFSSPSFPPVSVRPSARLSLSGSLYLSVRLSHYPHVICVSVRLLHLSV